MIIKQFIDNKIYTVPLQGKLERNSNGSKTTPIFEVNYRKKYSNYFNILETRLAGALTGAISNIIVIDCDNEATYKLFCSLDNPNNAFHFISKDKPEGGGSIVYRYDNTLANFSFNDSTIKLDFYSDNGFVYLPTEDNQTKEPWAFKELPTIYNIPTATLTLLQTLANKSIVKTKVADNKNINISNRLAPLLNEFVKNKKYNPTLFKIITPKSFRNLSLYVEQGHLHPKDVPQGRGSEYLSRISAILGSDISVNKELYQTSIELINSLKSNPKDLIELRSTVINPMIEERSIVDDTIIWQYDEYWEDQGFIFTNLRGNYLESFFDDNKYIYYLVNYDNCSYKTFTDKNKLLSIIRTLTGNKVPELAYDKRKKLINTTSNPHQDFGHLEDDKFNLFKQSYALQVLNNPEIYTDKYKTPVNTISYFKSLIPNEEVRNYTLSFIKTKLTTFRYSPVILFLLGVSGSGKDTFVKLIGKIVNPEFIRKPTPSVFFEKHNHWIYDAFFCHLDEYGNTLTSYAEKERALGLLKTYSGNDKIEIRSMQVDLVDYYHSMTFISTANKNPLLLDVDDRRMVCINTPNVLLYEPWVIESGGINNAINNIFSEVNDFCYYLATEIQSLDFNAYVTPPVTDLSLIHI